ncbi:hypothetical protein Syun_016282 [Stephania yunnanensis]|uniref:Uncharacterized protein n=1 Tax=Stephania yunnanensis TaxID=152371 RepID=A0AAP0J6C6_9MAGN
MVLYMSMDIFNILIIVGIIFTMEMMVKKKWRGKKVTARRKEPEELEIAAAQKKMSKKGTVRMTCQTCHVEGHNKRHHTNGQNKIKKWPSEGVQVDGNSTCGKAPLEQHNLFTTNATKSRAKISQPLPAMPSMMDFSQPIPMISPKSRAKIPVV